MIEFLKSLHEAPEFQLLLEKLKKERPVIPTYDYLNPESIERIKAMSLMQQGFDNAVKIINPWSQT